MMQEWLQYSTSVRVPSRTFLPQKERLDNGESFYSVAKDFGGEEESETECKRGEMEQAFETAAFNLKTGETSSIVEAGGKYYIIRCTSDNEKSKNGS